MLDITEQAADVLGRAHEAARRFDPDARIRIFRRGEAIETGFAHEPAPGDAVIEHAGITLFVEEGIGGVLDVSTEHDRLLVRDA